MSFFVAKNSRIQAKGANTKERSYWIIQKNISISEARPQNPSSFPVVQDWHHLTVQRHVVAYKLYVGFSCKEVKVTEALSTLRVIEMK